MSEPIAICIEDCDAVSDASRYMRCVAVSTGTPGLGLAADGEVRWQTGDPPACALEVSDDGCLILQRAAEAPPVMLQRAGRSLDVPSAKPVRVLDQDRIDIGPKKLRVHVHGRTDAVIAPAAFVTGDNEEVAQIEAGKELQKIKDRVSKEQQEIQQASKNHALDEIVIRDRPPLVVSVNEPPSDIAETLKELKRLKESRVMRAELEEIKIREHPPSMRIIEPPGEHEGDAAASFGFCTNCGKRLTKEVKFCPWCGTKLERE